MRPGCVWKISSTVALFILLGMIAPLGVAPATLYTVVNLGTLPQGHDSLVWSLNNRGQVVGSLPIRGTEPRAVILASAGLVTIKGFPGTDWSAALDINE